MNLNDDVWYIFVKFSGKSANFFCHTSFTGFTINYYVSFNNLLGILGIVYLFNVNCLP